MTETKTNHDKAVIMHKEPKTFCDDVFTFIMC